MPPKTVAELIEVLKGLPQDAIVLVDGYEWGYQEIHEIRVGNTVKTDKEPDYDGNYIEVSRCGETLWTSRSYEGATQVHESTDVIKTVFIERKARRG